MAMTTTYTVLHDGERNAVVQFTGVSDGVGQENNVVKVDMTTFLPPCKRAAIKLNTYEVVGGLVTLSWDALDPIPFDNLAYAGTRDYSRIGGFTVDPASAPGVTGNICLSTTGFDVGSSYSFVLELVKKF